MSFALGWDPEILRRINRRLCLDERYQYDPPDEPTPDPTKYNLRLIGNKKLRTIRAVLQADPSHYDETEAGFRDWWANWMAVAAGRQLWPDGNHRTAWLFANQVASFWFGQELEIEAQVADAIRAKSKAIIQDRWAQKPEPSVHEWLDPEHPLNRHYHAHQQDFALVPIDSD